MRILTVLVLSDTPLLREIIKQTVERIASTEITFAVNEATASQLSSKPACDVIIAVCKNVRDVNLNRFFRHHDHLARIIVIGWDEEQIAVYSRSNLTKATLRNLTKVLTNIREQHPGQEDN